MPRRIVPFSFALLTGICWAAACSRADEPAPASLPPPAKVRVDFDKQIKPLLQGRCLKCHARGKFKGGLSLETREAVLRGGESGPAAEVGKSADSLLVHLVAGHEPGRRMPEKGEPLTADDVGLLRAWVDQGLTWPDGFSFGFRRASLAPRDPEVPPAPAGLSLEHPIDRFVTRSLAEQGQTIEWTPVADRTFVRRTALDLIGLLPSEEQFTALDGDSRPGREARFVERLLADRRAYADHWLTFWNDALRNSYRGTGFIDGGRKTITQWLYQALYENKPYDRFVHELVSPVPGSEGFAKGIVWRGVVNASQAPPVQAAQNLSQVFLGTNLKCASCHDSFVNHWKLKESYALASVFAEAPLEVHRCDKPTGEKSVVGFVYPELGAIDSTAPRAKRLEQLADLVVKRENGRFARTIVNRLWAHLMGRGIVEPLDDMDQVPWSQDLLDWLAADFVAHGNDLKHTLGLIASSRAYRLPSVGVADPSSRSTFVFRGPLTKRMTAEQFADAVSSVTGDWPTASKEMIQADGRGQGGQIAAIRAAVAATSRSGRPKGVAPARVEAHWIWSDADAVRDPGGRILLRKVIRLDAVPEIAVAIATCDNELALYVNGAEVARSDDWTQPVAVDITKLLKKGDNVVAVEATNWPDDENQRGVQIRGANPAAFIGWVGGFSNGKQEWASGSDASWLWTRKARGDWKATSFQTDGWAHAVELPGANSIYGKVDLSAAANRLASPDDGTPLRAALAFDDALLTALGRTSREQVVTRRDPIATTLQALELSNGVTLDARLHRGAQRWVDGQRRDTDELVRNLFVAALGRAPSTEEGQAARELLGTRPSPQGMQDLLWTIFMLPEFQLIR
ncbi:MAG: DUF1553 domain-containing protein [Isosphaeraceae bacterium]|nr:DUF1553 domain-containing protein [Isosphaeraceae bacterium]